MAKGGFYFNVQHAHELREQMLNVANGLVDPSGGVSGLKDAYLHIANEAAENVKAHAPVYGRDNSRSDISKWRKPSMPVGSLRNAVYGKATEKGASVVADWEGPLILQEFGGKSVWSRGSGATFTAFRGALASKRGRTGTSRTTGHFTTNYRSHEIRKHVIYEKPRSKRGYFIWNVAWRMRSRIGWLLSESFIRVFHENGLEIQIAPGGAIGGDFQGEDFRRAA